MTAAGDPPELEHSVLALFHCEEERSPLAESLRRVQYSRLPYQRRRSRKTRLNTQACKYASSPFPLPLPFLPSPPLPLRCLPSFAPLSRHALRPLPKFTPRFIPLAFPTSISLPTPSSSPTRARCSPFLSLCLRRCSARARHWTNSTWTHGSCMGGCILRSGPQALTGAASSIPRSVSAPAMPQAAAKHERRRKSFACARLLVPSDAVSWWVRTAEEGFGMRVEGRGMTVES